MMRLTRQLTRGTEIHVTSTITSAICSITGSEPIHPETGHSVYFLSMRRGRMEGVCVRGDSRSGAARGRRFEEYSKLNDSIYYRDERGITVNLFIASELDDRERAIGLRQAHAFPRRASHVRCDHESARLLLDAAPEDSVVDLLGGGQGQRPRPRSDPRRRRLSRHRPRLEEGRSRRSGAAHGVVCRGVCRRAAHAGVPVRARRPGRRPGHRRD